MRSPSRQVRTSSCAAERVGVERRELGAGGLDRRRVELGAHLPARRPGRGRGAPSATGTGAASIGAGDEADVAATRRARRTPAAELDRAALGARRQADDLGGARAAERDRPAAARSASARSASRRRPGSSAASAVGGDRDRAGVRRRPPSSSSSDDAVEQRRLLGELGAGLGDVALGGRADLAQHRQDLGADPVAGEAAARRWSRRRRTAARAAAASSRTRVALETEQRPDDAAVARGQARAARASPGEVARR